MKAPMVELTVDEFTDLIRDWLEAERRVIAEFGGGKDYLDLVEKAAQRVTSFGLPWDHDKYIPEMLHELAVSAQLIELEWP